MWEVTTRKTPWEELPEHNFTKHLSEAVLSGRRPIFPPNTDCPPEFKQLLEMCWDTDPAKRPSFEQICTQLQPANAETAV